MNTISILTVFPDLYETFLKTSLLKRAQEKMTFSVAGFSSFCDPKERIDGPTAGHGAGMALRPEVLERAIETTENKQGKAFKIFVTPQGEKLTAVTVKKIAHIFEQNNHVMFVAGRYEGIDQRVHEEYADLEVSIGDYVLMGGDLPIMVILEAALRHVEGIVGQKESVENDSFSTPFFDYPTYTVPPRVWKNRAIPEILLSGNHKAMNEWRHETAVQNTLKKNFSWVRKQCKNKRDKALVEQKLVSHYVVLMHDQVIVQNGVVGTSSVTSLDIHDIARSSKTYGIKNYFLVTSLLDQQKIVNKILEFWNTSGIEYNKQRHSAVKEVELKSSLSEVIEAITLKEGKKPLLIATSAQMNDRTKAITYYDHTKVWEHDRPILFIFGTAKGLCEDVMKQCDYILLPVEGFTNFNHLSVRSAVAIILDRWLGCNFIEVD